MINNNNFAIDNMNINLRVMVNILSKQASGLRVCHINAQSLYPKIDEFRYMFEGSSIDIICVTETWFQCTM